MRTILFPTDFSELADNAFIYAIHLAKSVGAKLKVLHSYMSPVFASIHPGQPEMLGEMYANLESSEYETFRSNTPHLKEIAVREGFPEDQISFLFEEGPVSSVVREITQHEKIHLIVMGTHGQSGFLDRIIGSNTVSVINAVKTPIIAVPPHARFRGISKVLFTTLFRESDRTPLREALIMAKEVGAETTCAHVATQSDLTNLGRQMDQWSTDFDRYDVNFQLLDKIESVEHTITHYILDNNIDMLAVVKRNRGFFDRLFRDSTTHNLTFHTKVPILVYHEE
ncbi:universal stress protein [Sphingobacterium corticis]|uniref:Universal stress protein n=1 Tax=Sphingobacterium corticis TaxID=1812823 RepID=A0ABW5NLP8_9SPHI